MNEEWHGAAVVAEGVPSSAPGGASGSTPIDVELSAIAIHGRGIDGALARVDE